MLNTTAITKFRKDGAIKRCSYCQQPVAQQRYRYCDPLCRERAMYYRNCGSHPAPTTNADDLHRWYLKKVNAGQRGLAFNLTDTEVAALYRSPCAYCSATKQIVIDRYDNNVGYISGNCVPACVRCNTLKSQAPGEVFKAALPYIGKGYITCVCLADGSLLSLKDGLVYVITDRACSNG